MEEDGWVTAREERQGNRPPRRVYAITPTGEAAFQGLLRESLAAYPSPEFPSLVALNHLDALPGRERASLLTQRRRKIEARFDEVDAIPPDVRTMHPAIEYLHGYFVAELEWLDKIINRLEST